MSHCGRETEEEAFKRRTTEQTIKGGRGIQGIGNVCRNNKMKR